MRKVQGLLFMIALRYTNVTSISLCDTDDGYVEVENKSDNIFTCKDLPATSTVRWLISDPYGNDVNLGACPLPTSSQQSTCSTGTLAILFRGYRSSRDVSFLNFNATAGKNLQLMAGVPVTCRTETNYARCLIDYVYRASNVSCNVQFITIDKWSVSGQCNIVKTFSQSGRYRCRVYENQVPQADRKLIGNVIMSTTATGADAVSGNCAFHSFLPPDGHYNYTVVIVPGEVEFPFMFAGSNEIRKPPDTPNHSCPKIVQEGQGIQCACSVSDYGAPSGTLQWDNTGSTQLNLTNVTRGDTGRRFACRLTWNSTDVLTVNYTLLVTYYPDITITRSDNLTHVLQYHSNHTLVTSGHNVTFRCEADSNPPPASITWSGNINSSTGDLQILAADPAVHGGVYTCTVVTGTVPGDHRLPLASSRQITVVVTVLSTADGM